MSDEYLFEENRCCDEEQNVFALPFCEENSLRSICQIDISPAESARYI